MKNKLILQSIFILALIFTLSSNAHASVVTGVLSSAGVNTYSNTGGLISGTVGTSTNTGGSQVSGTLGNSTISGSVIGGTSTGGGGGSTSNNIAFAPTVGGVVLGASTSSSDTSPVNINSFSDDNTALQTNNEGYVLGAENRNEEIAVTGDFIPEAQASQVDQTADVINVGGGLSFDWFWIIVLFLVLVAISMYIYSRSKDRRKYDFNQGQNL